MPRCKSSVKHPRARSEDVINDALAYTRTLVADLSPTILHEFGLGAALAWLAEYMRRYDLSVNLIMEQHQEAVLPEDQAVLLFQSVRELLMNAHKHARSHEATVTVTRQRNSLRIEVRDEGQGFNPSAIILTNDEPPPSGVALRVIQYLGADARLGRSLRHPFGARSGHHGHTHRDATAPGA